MTQFKDLPKYELLRETAVCYPELQPRAVEAWVAMIRIGGEVIGAGESLLAERGLSRGRFATLMLLHCRGAASPSDIADCAGVTRASMTSIIDALEGDGFVVREPSTEDRRMQLIRITDTGQTHIDGILPGYFSSVADLMSGLDESEQAELSRLLMKLRETVGRQPTTHGGADADQNEQLADTGRKQA